MPKLTKLKLVTAAFMLAVSPAAFAQADTAENVAEVEITDLFTSADVDADGALNRDEFVSFVIMKSDAGDVDYSAIKLSGEYDDHFNTKDYNADGLLTAEEVAGPAEESVDEAAPETDTPDNEPG